jgi:Uma2 family endonuclease
MATLLQSTPITTLGDLLDRLGSISPKRVRYTPMPGTATEKDLIAIGLVDDRLYELVDGTLVEKAVGYRESLLTVVLISLIRTFVKTRKLGLVTGPDGMLRLFPGLIRGPDVAFVSWKKLPGRKVPAKPVPHLAPDLAIEVLSKGNTKKEMARKRREYFKAGVQLVWEVEPVKRQIIVYTSPKNGEVFEENQTVTGGEVLPGFTLSLSDLFAELDQEEGKE